MCASSQQYLNPTPQNTIWSDAAMVLHTQQPLPPMPQRWCYSCVNRCKLPPHVACKEHIHRSHTAADSKIPHPSMCVNICCPRGGGSRSICTSSAAETLDPHLETSEFDLDAATHLAAPPPHMPQIFGDPPGWHMPAAHTRRQQHHLKHHPTTNATNVGEKGKVMHTTRVPHKQSRYLGVTVTVTVFGTAKPCNPQGSQRLITPVCHP